MFLGVTVDPSAPTGLFRADGSPISRADYPSYQGAMYDAQGALVYDPGTAGDAEPPPVVVVTGGGATTPPKTYFGLKMIALFFFAIVIDDAAKR